MLFKKIFLHNINKLDRCIQLYEERNIATFVASAQRLWYHNLCSLIKSWLSFKGCHTCTHHGPILIYTSSGQLAFKCYFLYFSISIATNNISVGRMLTFNHYQFIHYFNLLALHCNVVVRHQLNFVTLQWKRYHFKRLDNTHGFKKKNPGPKLPIPFPSLYKF